MPPFEPVLDEDLSDSHLAALLAADARNASKRYSTQGLSAFLGRPSSAPKAKPNTRFLQTLVKNADTHNDRLRRKEDRERKERLRKYEVDDERRREDEHVGRLKVDRDGDDDNSRPRKRRKTLDEDEDGDRPKSHHRAREKDTPKDRPHRRRLRRNSSSDESEKSKPRKRSGSPERRRSHHKHRSKSDDHPSNSSDDHGHHRSHRKDKKRSSSEVGDHKHKGKEKQRVKRSFKESPTRPDNPDIDAGQSVPSSESSSPQDTFQAMRDSANEQRIQTAQAARLIAAGFSDAEVKAFQRSGAATEPQSHAKIKWNAIGEEREWDRGKSKDLTDMDQGNGAS